MGRYIFPGVRAEIQYQDYPFAGEEEEQPYRLTFRLVSDFTFARKRPIPTYNSAGHRTRGAIAGQIEVQNAPAAPRYDLQGVDILLDGRRGTTTDTAGHFFKSNIKPGAHLVELDTSNLPFELVPERTTFVVSVISGTTTGIEFVVKPEYGIAGRVTDRDGHKLEGRSLQLLDEEGNVTASARTDQFGLHRMDGIPAGTYTLRLVSESTPHPPERQVIVTDDFLFDQDIITE